MIIAVKCCRAGSALNTNGLREKEHFVTVENENDFFCSSSSSRRRKFTIIVQPEASRRKKHIICVVAHDPSLKKNKKVSDKNFHFAYFARSREKEITQHNYRLHHKTNLIKHTATVARISPKITVWHCHIVVTRFLKGAIADRRMRANLKKVSSLLQKLPAISRKKEALIMRP